MAACSEVAAGEPPTEPGTIVEEQGVVGITGEDPLQSGLTAQACSKYLTMKSVYTHRCSYIEAISIVQMLSLGMSCSIKSGSSQIHHLISSVIEIKNLLHKHPGRVRHSRLLHPIIHQFSVMTIYEVGLFCSTCLGILSSSVCLGADRATEVTALRGNNAAGGGSPSVDLPAMPPAVQGRRQPALLHVLRPSSRPCKACHPSGCHGLPLRQARQLSNTLHAALN